MKMTAIALSLTTALLTGSVFAQEETSSASLPRLDHVFLIMMENHAYSQIIGNPNAPFINQMAHTANLATNFYAVGHPSLTNYLEVVGGSNFGVINDHSPDWHNTRCTSNLISGVPADESVSGAICPIAGSGNDAATPAVDTTNEGTPTVPVYNTPLASAPTTAMTIADQLAAIGKSWKSYQESLPASGADAVNYADGIFSNLSAVNQSNVQKLYAVKHNPFVYFAQVQENTDPQNGLNNIVGFDGLNGLYADLRAGKAPNFSFIAPNQCHDMHGIGNGSSFCGYEPNPTLVQMGDATVKQIVGAIKGSESWKHGNNAIIVLWDENDFSAAPNQVAALVETNYGVQGVASAQPYNHFSLLKTLESGFRLSCLNHACDSNVQMMSDLFAEDRHAPHERDE